MARQRKSGWEGQITEADRATMSHTEFAARMLKPTAPQTLASMTAAAAAAPSASQPNIYEQHRPSGPQTGKVLSITRPEVFGVGTGTRTVMKVLLDRGGERTVTADQNSGNTRVAPDIQEGDQVKLQPTGPQHWEWVRVVPVAEKARKKRRVFTTDDLLGPDGLQKVAENFPNLRWEKRPAYESRTLTQIVSMYKEWAFALWPKVSFPMLVDRIEKLGTKAGVKEIVTELRYGEHVHWDAYRGLDDDELKKRLTKQQQRSANAEAIFNEYAAALQPGIRKANGDEDEEERQAGGLIDDDVDDDEFNKLMDSINGGSSAAAVGDSASKAAPATTASSASATKSAAMAAYAATKASREAAAQALDKRLKEGGGEGANMWSAVASKTAAAARTAAEQEAQAAADLAEGSGVARMSGQKRRRAVVDDDDEEEGAVFAPLAPASSSATAADEQAQRGEGGAGAAGEENPAAGEQPAAADTTAADVSAAEAEAAAMDDFLDEPAALPDATLSLTGAEEHVAQPEQDEPAVAAPESTSDSPSQSAAAGDEPVPAPSQQQPVADSTYTGGVEIEADADDFAALLGGDDEASQPQPQAAQAEEAGSASITQPLDTALPMETSGEQPQPASLDATQALPSA